MVVFEKITLRLPFLNQTKIINKISFHNDFNLVANLVGNLVGDRLSCLFFSIFLVSTSWFIWHCHFDNPFFKCWIQIIFSKSWFM